LRALSFSFSLSATRKEWALSWKATTPTININYRLQQILNFLSYEKKEWGLKRTGESFESIHISFLFRILLSEVNFFSFSEEVIFKVLVHNFICPDDDYLLEDIRHIRDADVFYFFVCSIGIMPQV